VHPVFMHLSNGLGVTSAARQQLKIGLIFGTLLWPSASLSSPLLPSQDQPTFFNVRICRDRQVLSELKAAASSTLKANVIIAHGKEPKWSGYDPNDIHLEAVSLSPDDERNSVFCSVTISAKGEALLVARASEQRKREPRGQRNVQRSLSTCSGVS
jgi:hypothetical protein